MTNNYKRLDPFWSFYGAKFRPCRAGLYPPPRSEDLVIEPFAGSAAYACTYASGGPALLVDSDEHVASIWEWLTSCEPDDVRRLPAPVDSTEEIPLWTTPGARALVGFWLARGSAHPRKTLSAMGRRYRREKPGSFWTERSRERVASQVPWLPGWRFVRGQWHEALSNLETDVRKTTWFFDRDYVGAGKHYREGGTSDVREVASVARTLGRLGARVIVCEAEGATWMDFKPLATVRSMCGSRGKKKSREVVWTANC